MARVSTKSKLGLKELVGLGERLRSARKRERLSQAALAEKLGVKQPTIGNWEASAKPPPNFIKSIDSIEDILGPIRSNASSIEEQVGANPSEFGLWLAEQRVAKKWSVAQLAQKAQVTIPTIYYIESGKSQNPQEGTRQRLITALGVDLPAEIKSQIENDARSVGNISAMSDFDPNAGRDLLPNVAGVYVLYDRTERPVYIGKSKNIRDRISNNHQQKFWFKSPIVMNGSYIAIEDKALRHHIEQIMIKILKSNLVINIQSTETFSDD